MKNHILPHYEEILSKLHEDVSQLGNKVLKELHELSLVLPDQKMNVVHAVIADEESLVEESDGIRKLSDQILAQFHPLASDLRHVIGLSRCGDKLREVIRELASIARQEKVILEEQAQFRHELDDLFALAFQELEGSLLALWSKETSLARSVRLQDKALDDKHRLLMKEIIADATQKRIPVHQNVHLLFVIRSLERIGDHAKGICESVIFMREAEDIRHKKEG